MIRHLLHSYASTLSYAQRLVADVPAEKMAYQPAPGMNHPAWVLGHLGTAANFAAQILGGENKTSEAWNALFSPQSAPQPDAAIYPDKQTLLNALVDGHERVAAALSGATTEQLARPFPKEEFRSFWPTVGDAVFYLTVEHDAQHLGQLSAWRRVQGMPGV